MKKHIIKPASFKTTFITHRGKRSVKVPFPSNKNKLVKASVASNHLNEIHEELSGNEHATSSGLSLHQKRLISTTDNWENIRELLINAYVEESSRPSCVCCVICKHLEANVSCEQCCPGQYFCIDCAKSAHINQNQ